MVVSNISIKHLDAIRFPSFIFSFHTFLAVTPVDIFLMPMFDLQPYRPRYFLAQCLA